MENLEKYIVARLGRLNLACENYAKFKSADTVYAKINKELLPPASNLSLLFRDNHPTKVLYNALIQEPNSWNWNWNGIFDDSFPTVYKYPWWERLYHKILGFYFDMRDMFRR